MTEVIYSQTDSYDSDKSKREGKLFLAQSFVIYLTRPHSTCVRTSKNAFCSKKTRYERPSTSILDTSTRKVASETRHFCR